MTEKSRPPDDADSVPPDSAPQTPINDSSPAHTGDSYEVGFAKPPKEKQFPPGVSGNPKGRAKGQKSLAEAVLKELNKKIKVKRDGRIIKLPKLDVMVGVWAQESMQGNMVASRLLAAILQTLPPERFADEDAPLSAEELDVLKSHSALLKALEEADDEK